MNPERSRVFDLPLQDQLQLVEDLWDHIAASKEPLPVPDWQKDELDRRKRNFEANPHPVAVAKRRFVTDWNDGHGPGVRTIRTAANGNPHRLANTVLKAREQIVGRSQVRAVDGQ